MRWTSTTTIWLCLTAFGAARIPDKMSDLFDLHGPTCDMWAPELDKLLPETRTLVAAGMDALRELQQHKPNDPSRRQQHRERNARMFYGIKYTFAKYQTDLDYDDYRRLATAQRHLGLVQAFLNGERGVAEPPGRPFLACGESAYDLTRNWRDINPSNPQEARTVQQVGTSMWCCISGESWLRLALTMGGLSRSDLCSSIPTRRRCAAPSHATDSAGRMPSLRRKSSGGGDLAGGDSRLDF